MTRIWRIPPSGVEEGGERCCQSFSNYFGTEKKEEGGLGQMYVHLSKGEDSGVGREGAGKAFKREGRGEQKSHQAWG